MEHAIGKRPLAALVVAVVAGGCALSDPTGPGSVEETLVVGTVEFYLQPIVIEVPDTVVAGASFEVRVRTFGGGCEREGPTRIRMLVGGVVVTPWDYTVVPPDDVNFACTEELKAFDHVAELTFDDPGEALVQIVGRRLPADTLRTFTRNVHVR